MGAPRPARQAGREATAACDGNPPFTASPSVAEFDSSVPRLGPGRAPHASPPVRQGYAWAPRGFARVRPAEEDMAPRRGGDRILPERLHVLPAHPPRPIPTTSSIVVRHHVRYTLVKDWDRATRADLWNAFSLAAREQLIDPMLVTERRYVAARASASPTSPSSSCSDGRSAAPSSTWAGRAVARRARELGLTLDDVEELEPGAGARQRRPRPARRLLPRLARHARHARLTATASTTSSACSSRRSTTAGSARARSLAGRRLPRG